MRARRRTPTLIAFVLLAAGACGAALRDTSARAGAGPSVPGADLVVLATPHEVDPRSCEVRVVHVDASGARASRWARIDHAPGAVARGDVVANGRAAVVVADLADAPPGDWSSGLWRADDTGSVRLLARGLYHASRPLASRDGRIYVEAGTAGPWPTRTEIAAGRLRVDDLTIRAIDPDTGAARDVYASTGYTLHLAGELGGELVVYRVAPEGAELLAIERTSGRSRLVTRLLPYARDFSVDEGRGAIVMSNRDERDSRTWVVDRVDLATGNATRMSTSAQQVAPFALRSGAIFAGFANTKRLGPAAASPRDVEVVLAASNDGAWLASNHVEGAFDVATATHAASGVTVRLTSGDERIEPIGFASGGGVAR